MTVRDYLVLKSKSYNDLAINQAAYKSKTNVPSNRAMFEKAEEKLFACGNLCVYLLSLLPVEALDMELYSEVEKADAK